MDGSPIEGNLALLVMLAEETEDYEEVKKMGHLKRRTDNEILEYIICIVKSKNHVPGGMVDASDTVKGWLYGLQWALGVRNINLLDGDEIALAIDSERSQRERLMAKIEEVNDG